MNEILQRFEREKDTTYSLLEVFATFRFRFSVPQRRRQRSSGQWRHQAVSQRAPARCGQSG